MKTYGKLLDLGERLRRRQEAEREVKREAAHRKWLLVQEAARIRRDSLQREVIWLDNRWREQRIGFTLRLAVFVLMPVSALVWLLLR